MKTVSTRTLTKVSVLKTGTVSMRWVVYHNRVKVCHAGTESLVTESGVWATSRAGNSPNMRQGTERIMPPSGLGCWPTRW
jgi:hypothetical protein